MVGTVGRLQVRSWVDKDSVKRWSTDVVIEEQHFAQGKKDGSNLGGQAEGQFGGRDGFHTIADTEDDDLPF